MNILHIDSAITGDDSANRQLSSAIFTRLSAANGTSTVVYRDFVADPLSHVTLDSHQVERVAIPEEYFAANFYQVGTPFRELEHDETYLKSILHFVEITLEFVETNRIQMSPEHRTTATDGALAQVARSAA